MKKLLLVFLGMLLACCNRIEPIADPLAGTTQTLYADCVLVEIKDSKKDTLGVDYALIAISRHTPASNGKVVSKGEKIKITAVKKLRIDARGEWLGVFGEYVDPDGKVMTFYYWWEPKSADKVAPWENKPQPKYPDAEYRMIAPKKVLDEIDAGKSESQGGKQ